MNENETQSAGDSMPATESTTPSVGPKKKSPVGKYIAAIIVVAVIVLGVLYALEKEGRSSTSIFSDVIEKQVANEVVATVNGVDILNADLKVSLQQFGQAAEAQGVDMTDPDTQLEFRGQALDVLVNTELLKQAAADRGIVVTDEETAERLAEIEEDIGGPEVLAERMAELGIDDERLHRDIKDELIIQQLLDAIFLEAEIVVTDEEISEVYESAGGEDAGLPALEEVRPQVEAQIRSGKEQEAIDAYLDELKEGAEIVTN